MPEDLLERSFAVQPLGAPRRGWEWLYPYQQAAVEQFSMRRHLLLGHEPGLGKTAMGLCLSTLPGPCERAVIVVPPAVLDQWWVQWQRRIEDRRVHVFRTVAAVRSILNEHGTISLGPDSLVHLVRQDPMDTLVIDEVHRFKGRDTRRTKALFGRGGLARRAGRVVALTGTPLLASPIDLYPMLRTMAPDIAPNLPDFASRYCPPVSRYIPGLSRSITTYPNGTNLPELATRLRRSVLIRPSVRDCGLQLPPLRYEQVRVPVIDPAGGMFTEEELTAVFMQEGPLAAAAESDPVFGELRRLTGMAVATAAIDWLVTLVESGARPLIWCWHREVAEFIASRLEGCALVHGGVNPVTRRQILDDFVSGRRNSVVATIAASGTGVDGLQAATSTCVFVERSYTPAENDQATARVHRIGQRNGTIVYDILGNTAQELSQLRVLTHKSDIIRRVFA